MILGYLLRWESQCWTPSNCKMGTGIISMPIVDTRFKERAGVSHDKCVVGADSRAERSIQPEC